MKMFSLLNIVKRLEIGQMYLQKNLFLYRLEDITPPIIAVSAIAMKPLALVVLQIVPIGHTSHQAGLREIRADANTPPKTACLVFLSRNFPPLLFSPTYFLIFVFQKAYSPNSISDPTGQAHPHQTLPRSIVTKTKIATPDNITNIVIRLMFAKFEKNICKPPRGSINLNQFTEKLQAEPTSRNTNSRKNIA